MPNRDREVNKELLGVILKLKNILGILNENFVGIKSEL